MHTKHGGTQQLLFYATTCDAQDPRTVSVVVTGTIIWPSIYLYDVILHLSMVGLYCMIKMLLNDLVSNNQVRMFMQ